MSSYALSRSCPTALADVAWSGSCQTLLELSQMCRGRDSLVASLRQRRLQMAFLLPIPLRLLAVGQPAALRSLLFAMGWLPHLQNLAVPVEGHAVFVSAVVHVRAVQVRVELAQQRLVLASNAAQGQNENTDRSCASKSL